MRVIATGKNVGGMLKSTMMQHSDCRHPPTQDNTTDEVAEYVHHLLGQLAPGDRMIMTTAVSAAAAVTIGLLRLGIYQQLTDPFADFLIQMSESLQ